MDLRWLKPLLGRPAPFTTVYLDATRAESAGETETADRWRALRRTLERDGASSGVLDEIGDLVATPTGVRGPHGRVVVADANGVVVDRVLAEPPAQSTAVHGPAPALLPAVRAADETVDLLVARVDRNGADLARTSHGASPAAGATLEHVEGGHDDVHKTREGGLDRRSQTRAEDSWQRNAEAVAAALDRKIAEHAPDIVVLTGDVRAVALVKEAVGRPTAELVVEVPGGARGEGANQESFVSRVSEVVTEFRHRRRDTVLDRFRQQLGRGEGAVTALDDVIEVLRRGQVDELVLHTSALTALTERELWVGPEPLQVAVGEDELTSLGVGGDRRRLPAGVALVRAALGQDAGVTFAENGTVDLVDGIGALLRWSDGSTPSEAVPSQSADQRRLRTVV
ncbi:baeRF2 domain-containing protein [Cellulomonas sp. URHB0016]